MLIRNYLFSNRSVQLWTLLILGSLLAACGDGPAQPSATERSATNDTRKKTIEKYQAEVKQRVSRSIVSSFSRDWGVSEASVECVLADVEIIQLSDVASDDDVAAVFDKCGVDTAVVK